MSDPAPGSAYRNSCAEHGKRGTRISGGSRRIGAATARPAASQAFDPCSVGASRLAAAERVAGQVRGRGTRARVDKFDVSVEADVQRLFATAGDESGNLRAFVNCAGIAGVPGTFERSAADDNQENFDEWLRR